MLAHVFKVTVDPYVGKMGVFRVHQGTVTKDSQLYIGDGRKPFKVGHLFMLQGKDHVEVPRALPGDIVRGRQGRRDPLRRGAARRRRGRPHPPDAAATFRCRCTAWRSSPSATATSSACGRSCSKLVDEDPCLRVEHVAATNETVVYGLGELHLRVLLERLREVYNFEVNTRPPRIAYRETITAPAEGHHRHKKQTGGAGQFGEVFLRVEPLPRGARLRVRRPGQGRHDSGPVHPGGREGRARGAGRAASIAGYPVVDVRVIVYDGKHHSVDSKEIAFVTAGRKAFMAAVREARPIVLEPIVNVEITAPERAIGDITGDLSSRRGLVSGTPTARAGTMVVRGQVPMSELSGYQSRLNAMTGGQGRYTIELSHYEAVPPHGAAAADGAVQGEGRGLTAFWLRRAGLTHRERLLAPWRRKQRSSVARAAMAVEVLGGSQFSRRCASRPPSASPSRRLRAARPAPPAQASPRALGQRAQRRVAASAPRIDRAVRHQRHLARRCHGRRSNSTPRSLSE